MEVWNTTAGAFLLAFSALLSIVNPLSGAFIYNEVTAGYTHEERVRLARKIGIYSAFVMLVSIWAGASVIGFFGVSLAALRLAGGIVVSVRAWEMLSVPQVNENRKQEQAAGALGQEDIAFFPLTIPFTTGPGTIAVAIALSSSSPSQLWDLPPFFVGTSAAALLVALVVTISYAYADWIVSLLGPSRSRIFGRLAAFLLLCVGMQIFLTGLTDVLTTIIKQASVAAAK